MILIGSNIKAMSETIDKTATASLNPWTTILVTFAVALLIAGPMMVASGATIFYRGSNVFIGVSSADISTGQGLLIFGGAASTAGLFALILALGVSAVRWRRA